MLGRPDAAPAIKRPPDRHGDAPVNDAERCANPLRRLLRVVLGEDACVAKRCGRRTVGDTVGCREHATVLLAAAIQVMAEVAEAERSAGATTEPPDGAAAVGAAPAPDGGQR